MSSLLAERGPIHVHVGATILLEGDPPGLDELLAHVDKRLGLVPRFRQRVRPDPLGLTNPVWADDPRFDLRWHVRHTALPGPGTMAQLRELVGRVISQPLDLERPLWQLYLIEGLEGGRHAYISKTHHALVDGVSAVDVGTIMLDPNPEGTEIPIGEERWDPDEPSPELLLVRAASDGIRAPLRAAGKAARSALTMPRGTASAVMRTAEGFANLAAARTEPPAHLPQPGDRPRPPGRLRRDRAGGPEARPRRRRRNGQRRHPVDRRRWAAAPVRAPRPASSRSSSSPWCR